MRLLTHWWTGRFFWRGAESGLRLVCAAAPAVGRGNRAHLSRNISGCPAIASTLCISKKMKLLQMQFVAPTKKKKKSKKANSLSQNRANSRQHIIHYRKYKRLMQFYRRLEGAKFAGPDNRLQISPWKMKKKRRKIKKAGGGLRLLSGLFKPWELQPWCWQEKPLILQSVAIRNTAIFSHVFQPLLLFLPTEQPFGR